MTSLPWKEGIRNGEAMCTVRPGMHRPTAVPVVGRVTAGQPIFAEENLEEYVPIPDIMLGEGEHFILHVKGDSMMPPWAAVSGGLYPLRLREKSQRLFL